MNRDSYTHYKDNHKVWSIFKASRVFFFMFPIASFKFLFFLFNYFENYLISFFFQFDLETHIVESNLNFYFYGDIDRDCVCMCVCFCVAMLKMVKGSHLFCYMKVLFKPVEVLFLCILFLYFFLYVPKVLYVQVC